MVTYSKLLVIFWVDVTVNWACMAGQLSHSKRHRPFAVASYPTLPLATAVLRITPTIDSRAAVEH